MKILVYGINLDNNFGGPSLLNGAIELLRKKYNNPEIIFYQKVKPCKNIKDDFDIEIKYYNHKKRHKILFNFLLFNLRIKIKKHQELFYDIKTSDLIVNIYGICFCQYIEKQEKSIIGSLEKIFYRFPISVLSKYYKNVNIKFPSSYGPIGNNNLKNQAKFSYKFLFNKMFSREETSRLEIEKVIGEQASILNFPDIGNLMRYDKTNRIYNFKYLIISVSYQIKKQWLSDEPYEECIKNLITKIKEITNYKILLLPNEYSLKQNNSDVYIAKEISNEFDDTVKTVEIKDIKPSIMKNIISQSELVIASRYHSAVAALSSCVPTLIIGWHHKYKELLDIYNQNDYLINSSNCSTRLLIEKFEHLLNNKENIKYDLINNKKKVYEKIYSINKYY